MLSQTLDLVTATQGFLQVQAVRGGGEISVTCKLNTDKLQEDLGACSPRKN